jgi:hypothetical protein
MRGFLMKNFIEVVYKLMFVAGVLFIGVGIMAVFMMGGYANECENLMSTGEQSQVEILEKGVSYSGGGSRSRNRNEYFNVKYLGESKERKFTRITPALKEFETYEEGDIVEVVYDLADPSEAIITKTPAQIKELKAKPFFIIFYGIIMICISLGLGKLRKKLAP